MTEQKIQKLIEIFMTARAKAQGNEEMQSAINKILSGLYDFQYMIQKMKK